MLPVWDMYQVPFSIKYRKSSKAAPYIMNSYNYFGDSQDMDNSGLAIPFFWGGGIASGAPTVAGRRKSVWETTWATSNSATSIRTPRLCTWTFGGGNFVQVNHPPTNSQFSLNYSLLAVTNPRLIDSELLTSHLTLMKRRNRTECHQHTDSITPDELTCQFCVDIEKMKHCSAPQQKCHGLSHFSQHHLLKWVV